jgi:hypothetical protein
LTSRRTCGENIGRARLEVFKYLNGNHKEEGLDQCSCRARRHVTRGGLQFSEEEFLMIREILEEGFVKYKS